ncbi:hypothetical protein L332_12420 [Agrococcus pavilionensis RW1]|uniref:DUF559 domain-containing protein n=1 Tax=Agrococcus pavilionensis RW1 TaxID=1330458 RepID=U1LRW0_9MICO|nr:DUF559 domain-containing protein [Agrococcus pavilionensis]ERG65239.1 hypothetical protein L332_12420 [Agrococcus pavilionensis RW1]
MPRPAPLPEPLASGAFSTAEALRLGVSRRRLRASDLARPFHGVRAGSAPDSVLEMARAFAPRMRDGHAFAGLTAARLWGLPVESTWRADEPLVIGVPDGMPRTRATGVRSLRFATSRLGVGEIDGLPTLGPIGAFVTMGRSAEHEQLVQLADALVTPSERYRDLRFERPYATLGELSAAVEQYRRGPGAAALLAAIAAARVGVDSPRESRSRLVIVAAGLPEPVVQHRVWHEGRLVAELDLAYPELRIAIEYEGEHHRTDAEQWAKDIRRQEELEALGWIVIRVTKADLRDGGRPLVARVRAARARRLGAA